VFGFFAKKFQGSFGAEFDGALGHALLCVKQFSTQNWEEFEPPGVNKRRTESTDV
jgi:hypothetical protein